MSVSKQHGNPGMQRQQGGAYAVEYAFVFPIFFLLLYGTLAYGMIFTMRLGLQHAAEEGARAALRFPELPSDPDLNQLQRREAEAERIAGIRASWLNGLAVPTTRAEICLTGVAGDPCAQSLSGGPAEVDDCAGINCQIVVTVTYSYADNPVFPSLPGFGLIFPATLQGRARAVLDGLTLSL